MTAHRLVFLVLLACALTAAPSAAAPFQTIAEQAPSPARADGASTIAYMPAPGMLRLLDAQGAQTAAVDLSAACASPPSAVDAIGGGVLAFSCAYAEARLLDLATRTVRVPAGVPEALRRAFDYTLGGGWIDAVGVHGVRLQESAYHSGQWTSTIDWRSGARVADPTDPTQLLDVDSPTLVTTLCEPLRRRPWDLPSRDIDPWPLYDPLLFEAPYGVTWGPRSPLTLQRCGDTRARVLEPRNRRDWHVKQAVLDAGFVSWIAGDALRAYLPACAVRVERPFMQAPGAYFPTLAHVAGGIVFSEQRSYGAPLRIELLSLDGVCERTTRAWRFGAANESRRVAVPLRSASLRVDRPGWLARRLGTGTPRTPRLAVRPGTDVSLTAGAQLRGVRWRLGDGRWRAAAVRSRVVRLPLPALATATVLRAEARYVSGGKARLAVRIAPLR